MKMVFLRVPIFDGTGIRSVAFLALVVVHDPVKDLFFGRDGGRGHERCARRVRQQTQATITKL